MVKLEVGAIGWHFLNCFHLILKVEKQVPNESERFCKS
jgi:hypothetical protein